MHRLSETITKGLVRSCHDCSEGGLAVAAAEMALAGGIGMELDLRKMPYSGEKKDYKMLFSESNSRFLVEVSRKNKKRFMALMSGAAKIGETVTTDILDIKGLRGNNVVHSRITDLKEAWQRTLKW